MFSKTTMATPTCCAYRVLFQVLTDLVGLVKIEGDSVQILLAAVSGRGTGGAGSEDYGRGRLEHLPLLFQLFHLGLDLLSLLLQVI